VLVTMSSHQTQVVVGFDFSESARFALERTIALNVRGPSRVLHFGCILDPHSGLARFPTKEVDIAYADRVRDELSATVALALRTARAEGRIHFHIHVRVARNPAKELLALAKEVGADLIVVGCKGLRGIERVVLGSVSERIVREAGCPVVIARPKAYPHVEHTDVVEVEAHAHHTGFRFTYDDTLGIAEPMRWPGA
jgi:nucleotide-binding universal stress UspA family protein